MKNVIIYTDGACSGNPGPGGWGAILKFGEVEREISGGDADTTNNRMELTAVINALNLLKEPCAVDLYSDSSYVVDAFLKGWVNDWVRNGWQKSNKEKVKNPDLWQQLYELSKVQHISWHLVKGHADNEYNNRCDALAVAESKKFVKDDGIKEDKKETFNNIPLDVEKETRPPVGPADLVETTTGAERVFEGRIFAIDRFFVNTPAGQPATRDVMRHPGGAVVVAVNDDQDVLMVKQFRRAVDQVMYELPAGKLEYGEDPAVCAARELEEETGYKPGSLELLTSMKTSPAISDETLHIYLATDLTQGEQHLDENEFVEVSREPLEVLIEQIFTGEITDSKTIVGLLMADRMING